MTDKDKEMSAAEQKAIRYYCKNKSTNQIDITNIIMDEDWFAYDNLITSGNTTYAVEVKVRKKYSYQEIQKDYNGQILEKKKLNRIIEQLKKDNVDFPILYYIFFSDRLCIYSLDSNPDNYIWTTLMFQKSNTDKTKVPKEVALLSESDIIEVIKY
jgi:hypothetical protein